jgi:hypothetical protein
MATPQYNLQQQAFTISVLSNNAAGDKGDPASIESQLQSNVSSLLSSSTFTNLIGNWSLVWGPVVWQNSGSQVADNVMMAAQNADTKDIVVAIAGTNPNSAFDRGTEDLDVGTTVTFDQTTDAWISQGASDGITNLEGMTDPTSGLSLVDWLQSLGSTGGNLIIAGHSLGGALAPTLALDLVFNTKITPSNYSNVYVYPTAGPSPGNQAFSDLFAKTFPAVSGSKIWDGWNQNVTNSLDAVPHGWTGLSSLPSLYPPINNGQPLTCIGTVVTKKLEPALNGLTYANVPTVIFGGAFNMSVTVPVSGVTCQWLAQAIYQHIPAYFAEIVPDLVGTLPAPTLPGDVCSALDAWCDPQNESGGQSARRFFFALALAIDQRSQLPRRDGQHREIHRSRRAEVMNRLIDALHDAGAFLQPRLHRIGAVRFGDHP